MALSGSTAGNFGSNASYRVRTDWSATQNIAGNISTVTARFYLISLSSWHTINAGNVQKNGYIIIEGNRKNFTNNATLGANQTRELSNYTVNITHNSNGTRSFSIQTNFDIQVTLGSWIPSVGNSGSWALNTIPRASTGSISNFIASNSVGFTLNRASSAFDHKVRLHINGVFIKELNAQGSGGTFVFNLEENKAIFRALNGGNTGVCRIDIRTFQNGVLIGDWTSASSTCTSLNNGFPTAGNFTIGEQPPVQFTNWNADTQVTYTLKFIMGGFSKTWTNIKPASANWTADFTDAEWESMYAQIPNAQVGICEWQLWTYYGGIAVRNYAGSGRRNAVVNQNIAKPIIKGVFAYMDTNPTTVALTGSAFTLIQNKSTLTVIIPGNYAEAQKYSTITKIIVTIAGNSKEVPWSTSDQGVVFDTVNASTATTLTVYALDSRGIRSTDVKTVPMIPYSIPTLNSTVERVNNFESATDILAAGAYAPIRVGGAVKNKISYLRFRYKQSDSQQWSGYTNLTVTTNGVDFSGAKTTVTLDNSYSWDVEVTISDALGGTAMAWKTITEGKPIFFVDANKKSISLGKFPTRDNAFETDYSVYASSIRGAWGGMDMLADMHNGNIFLSAQGLDIVVGKETTRDVVLYAPLKTATNGVITNITKEGSMAAKRMFIGIDYDDHDKPFGHTDYTGVEIQGTIDGNNSFIDFHLGGLTPQGNNDFDGRIIATKAPWWGRPASSNTPNVYGALNGRAQLKFMAQYIIFSTSEFGGESMMVGNQWRKGDGGTTHMYVCPSPTGVLAVQANGAGGAYRPVQASAFSVQSERRVKTNIVDYTEGLDMTATDIVKRSRVRTYHLKNDVENGDYYSKKVGLVIDEAPAILKGAPNMLDQQTEIMVAYAALQETIARVEELEANLEDVWLII